jgi:hypothetical protein
MEMEVETGVQGPVSAGHGLVEPMVTEEMVIVEMEVAEMETGVIVEMEMGAMVTVVMAAEVMVVEATAEAMEEVTTVTVTETVEVAVAMVVEREMEVAPTLAPATEALEALEAVAMATAILVAETETGPTVVTTVVLAAVRDLETLHLVMATQTVV